MMKLAAKFGFILAAILLLTGLAPVGSAQSVTRIYTVPDGVFYTVDGQYFNHATSFNWATGSKHTLAIMAVQTDITGTTQWAFQNWASGPTVFQQNPLIITADPSLTEFHAIVTVSYGLSLRFFPCSDASSCAASPGTVYVNGTPYTSDTTIFFSVGGQAVLQAAPNPGHIFLGWAPGLNQVVQGFLDTVTMNAPALASPRFQQARPINLSTVPAGLQVLADGVPVLTPSTLDWGWDTTHSVAPVSPQQDNSGLNWVFSSWSDGGASTHPYTVGEVLSAASLTATYVRAATITILTSPPGLKITVDGRNNWPGSNFFWGVGESHQLAAPTVLTDAKGNSWQWVSWSNGGPASQLYTVPSNILDTGAVLIATYVPMGQLTVNSVPSGLTVQVDGTGCQTPCNILRSPGTQVRVSAPASVPLAAGSRADFLSWSDGVKGDHSITLNSQTVVLEADYHVLNQLTLVANPAGSVTWQVQPMSVDGFYDSQSSVQVGVTALPGFKFLQWAGDLSGTMPSGTISMNAPRSVTAVLNRVPFIAVTGIANAAASTSQAGIAPGSIASIYGGSLAATTALGPSSPLTQTLAGVTVMANGQLFPLFFVSPTQINFLLPPNFPIGPATLTVSVAGQADLQSNFTVVRNAPGLFQQVNNGQAFAIVLHEDGSLVTTVSPAQSGELLTMFGTGFGPTNPPTPEGFPIPAQPVYQVSDPATVTIGDSTVISPDSVLAAPGRVGVDEVQFRLGSGAPTGMNTPLHLTVNGQDSNAVLLPVQ
ncbi:MAG TPA: PEGA domain-containing protein [Bryobacteraceae bacterium]|jgi:uncharacterized protein (TIGR03437 family)|nr:PEGA domain-containing protein [Bryobacteraceae bacterium]